jgi:hypothetical protein
MAIPHGHTVNTNRGRILSMVLPSDDGELWERLGGRNGAARDVYKENRSPCEPVLDVREPRPTKLAPPNSITSTT